MKRGRQGIGGKLIFGALLALIIVSFLNLPKPPEAGGETEARKSIPALRYLAWKSNADQIWNASHADAPKVRKAWTAEGAEVPAEKIGIDPIRAFTAVPGGPPNVQSADRQYLTVAFAFDGAMPAWSKVKVESPAGFVAQGAHSEGDASLEGRTWKSFTLMTTAATSMAAPGAEATFLLTYSGGKEQERGKVHAVAGITELEDGLTVEVMRGAETGSPGTRVKITDATGAETRICRGEFIPNRAGRAWMEEETIWNASDVHTEAGTKIWIYETPLAAEMIAQIRIATQPLVTERYKVKLLPYGGDDGLSTGSQYRISAGAIEEARAAARNGAMRGLKERRPAALADMNSDEAIRGYIAANFEKLGDTDSKIRDAVIGDFIYLGDRAFAQLVKGLESENRLLRNQCVMLLGRRGSAAVPYLEKVLRADPDKGIRAAAAGALGQTFDPQAVPPLLASLQDPDFQVRVQAIGALKYLKDERSVAPLRAILADAQANGQLRHQAAEALLHIDHEAGEKAIAEVLGQELDASDRHNFELVLKENRSFPYVRPDSLELYQLARDAGTLAGEAYGKTEMDQLIGHIRSDDTIGELCMLALGELHAEEAVPAILAAGRGSNALHALAMIASPEAVDYLLGAIQTSDDEERRLAIDGLGQSGGRWAVPLLIDLLNDPSLRKTHTGEIYPIDSWNGVWPDWHLAHAALALCLGRAGLSAKWVNLATGAQFDVDEEIARVKQWWEDHGRDFMQGKPVPNPELSMVWLIT